MKQKIVIKKTFAAVVAMLLLGGCVSQPQTESVKLKNYTAHFVDPLKTESQNDCGRFNRGGWLFDVTRDKSGESLFHTSTVIPKQHAYGMTEEFYYPAKLKDDREFMRIGIGEVRRPRGKKNAFWDRPVKFVPWYFESKIEENGKIKLFFWQFVDRHYFFRKTIECGKDSNIITYHYEFLNLSGKEMVDDVFWHPFFVCEKGATPWFVMSSGPDFANKAKIPLMPSGETGGYRDVDVAGGDRYFGFGVGDQWIGTFHIEGAHTVGLWLDRGVFAVEPKVKMRFPPQQKVEWKWEFILP